MLAWHCPAPVHRCAQQPAPVAGWQARQGWAGEAALGHPQPQAGRSARQQHRACLRSAALDALHFTAYLLQRKQPPQGFQVCPPLNLLLNPPRAHLLLQVDDALHLLVHHRPLRRHQLLPLLRAAVEEAGVDLQGWSQQQPQRSTRGDSRRGSSLRGSSSLQRRSCAPVQNAPEVGPEGGGGAPRGAVHWARPHRLDPGCCHFSLRSPARQPRHHPRPRAHATELRAAASKQVPGSSSSQAQDLLKVPPHLALLVLQRDVAVQHVAVLQALGHVGVPRAVVQHQAPVHTTQRSRAIKQSGGGVSAFHHRGGAGNGGRHGAGAAGTCAEQSRALSWHAACWTWPPAWAGGAGWHGGLARQAHLISRVSVSSLCRMCMISTCVAEPWQPSV